MDKRLNFKQTSNRALFGKKIRYKGSKAYVWKTTYI